MRFTNRRFRLNDVVTLSFRKVLSNESSMISGLVEEVCDKTIDKVLNEKLSKSVQDLAGRKVANKLSVD